MDKASYFERLYPLQDQVLAAFTATPAAGPRSRSAPRAATEAEGIADAKGITEMNKALAGSGGEVMAQPGAGGRDEVTSTAYILQRRNPQMTQMARRHPARTC